MQHLRYLDYVDAVARCGSIRSAAEALHVAASAVNRRIKELERELDTPIFERLPSGVRLTAAGELFVGYARRRAADLDHVRSEIESLRGLRRGDVSMAVSQALAPAFLPRTLVDFQAEHPGVSFAVKVLDRERAVQALLDFEVDLALVFNPPPGRGVRILAQARQRTCAVVAADHPLAGHASVRLKDCLKYPVALPDGSLSGRGVIDDLLENASEQPVAALVCNSFEMMRSFACQSGGVSFQIALGAAGDPRLRAIPIEERSLPASRLVLMTLRGRVLPVASARFAEHLRGELVAMHQA